MAKCVFVPFPHTARVSWTSFRIGQKASSEAVAVGDVKVGFDEIEFAHHGPAIEEKATDTYSEVRDLTMW